MAVLKRFSYDNIVEHNPTAPDPVDYDGGGEGSGGAKSYYGGSYTAFLPDNIPASQTAHEVTCTIDINIQPLIPSGTDTSNLLSMVNIYQLWVPSPLKDYYAGYSCSVFHDEEDNNNLVVDVKMRLLPHQDAISLTAESFFMSFYAAFVGLYIENQS